MPVLLVSKAVASRIDLSRCLLGSSGWIFSFIAAFECICQRPSVVWAAAGGEQGAGLKYLENEALLMSYHHLYWTGLHRHQQKCAEHLPNIRHQCVCWRPSRWSVLYCILYRHWTNETCGILDSDVCGVHSKSEKSEECWIWRWVVILGDQGTLNWEGKIWAVLKEIREWAM